MAPLLRKLAICAAAPSLALAICAAHSARASVESTSSQQATDESKQEQFDRDKVTLKDRAQESIDSANANVDALNRMAKSANGATGTQYKDIADDLSLLRDHLKDDLTKIDKASINDWAGVKPVVDRDITATNAALQHATSITHVQPPASKP